MPFLPWGQFKALFTLLITLGQFLISSGEKPYKGAFVQSLLLLI